MLNCRLRLGGVGDGLGLVCRGLGRSRVCLVVWMVWMEGMGVGRGGIRSIRCIFRIRRVRVRVNRSHPIRLRYPRERFQHHPHPHPHPPPPLSLTFTPHHHLRNPRLSVQSPPPLDHKQPNSNHPLRLPPLVNEARARPSFLLLRRPLQPPP